ncbi:MarR family winged helix-turn-helix transcriptional regulator [Mucilaginibacter sp. HMF5004]|uniref:MarR family winged helix-turn-helix transcriptional regulator n=1 Tax=Mucilaginibacter rivuli TaxID=2857527 RepID=UPI001C5EBEFC|nr:MarR family winged helix-turn-helix transcriptional regulator [Mucilaginibacter rivuli]MBW4891049.1 MarR family winged helix-turn-helix transcriptional regulator [Mucilaginibacter rivuli]
MNFGEDLSLQVMLAHKSYHQFLLKCFKDIDVYQHLQVIMLLNRIGGRCTQKELCTNLQVEKSYMTSIIEALIQKGYVFSDVNFKDRRSKMISLTTKAAELAQTVTSQMEMFTESMGEHLTWQEKHNCIRALKLVNENFKNATAEVSPTLNKVYHT